jgi:hypothetical protein
MHFPALFFHLVVQYPLLTSLYFDDDKFLEFKPKAYQLTAENKIRRGQTYECCIF